MPVSIAVLGDRNVEYLTHREIDATLGLVPADVDARWLPSPEAASASEADGLWVVPGTPYRDDDSVLEAIRRARTAGMPTLGTCGGFQYMVVEFARNAARMGKAAHAETDPDASDAVVARLSCSLVGVERQITAVAGTRVGSLCGSTPFTGFHWCNYGLAPEHEGVLVGAGLVVSARAPDAGVEAVELPGHPFYVATLFQPQVGSSSTGRLHPLIAALISAARRADPMARLAEADRLVDDE
jgi:CTP synthase (UTP-ammonia lyase)